MGDTLNVGDRLGTGQSLTSTNDAYQLILQDDGNLVLIDQGNPVWSTKTNGSGVVRATLQEDGNFVLYNGADEGIWSTKTDGNTGVRLVLQNDRNVVVYAGDAALWASDTVTDSPIPEAAEVPAPAAPAPAPKVTHTVVPGDTLWGLAEQYLGDGNRYGEIAAFNNIPNPDLINVGQVITIP
ncbi:LysM peptidoglycan-binding domain-containing protein [Gordonia sp. TBRC 11910]|uniref:LysM peptidoglycan-binding domain-containing protein n=1 Tax=Gordonia asplenii TaxID=2725283 RepID=A0A848L2Y3_9ACTN|nr:LysM peptidoglycan-binding domain-containing protein [Gordonia asplenii]NMO04792.1 LysM peptidoglycan-binding domain-containing protein [Gordonia asplenii]